MSALANTEPAAARLPLAADPRLRRRLAGATAYTWPNLALLGAIALAAGAGAIRFAAWLTVRGRLFAKPAALLHDLRELRLYSRIEDYPSILEETCAGIQHFSLWVVVAVMFWTLWWESMPRELTFPRRVRLKHVTRREAIRHAAERKVDHMQTPAPTTWDARRTLLLVYDWPILKCLVALLLILCTYALPSRGGSNLGDPESLTYALWLERSSLLNYFTGWEGPRRALECALAVIPIFAAHRMIVQLRERNRTVRRAWAPVVGWIGAWLLWATSLILAAIAYASFEEWIPDVGLQASPPSVRLAITLITFGFCVLLYAALRLTIGRASIKN